MRPLDDGAPAAYNVTASVGAGIVLEPTIKRGFAVGWLEDKVAKWARLIDECGGPGAAEEVLAGYERLAEATPEGRAAWSLGAMERLAEAIPDIGTRERIMDGRGCVFIEEFGEEPLLKLRKIYRETGDLETVFEAMACDREKHTRPHCEGNVVVEVKAPADAEAFAKAQTPDEKRVAYCHCPLARAGAASAPIPEPYCYCGGGWYRGIWEFILERPVRVEVLKSVMRGDEHCAFAVHLASDIASGKAAK
jgi:hypothetical protein